MCRLDTKNISAIISITTAIVGVIIFAVSFNDFAGGDQNCCVKEDGDWTTKDSAGCVACGFLQGGCATVPDDEQLVYHDGCCYMMKDYSMFIHFVLSGVVLVMALVTACIANCLENCPACCQNCSAVLLAFLDIIGLGCVVILYFASITEIDPDDSDDSTLCTEKFTFAEITNQKSNITIGLIFCATSVFFAIIASCCSCSCCQDDDDDEKNQTYAR